MLIKNAISKLQLESLRFTPSVSVLYLAVQMWQRSVNRRTGHNLLTSKILFVWRSALILSVDK